MQLIDTHTHLYLEQFNEDIDDVISKCQENSIDTFILPNIDSEHTRVMLELANSRKNIFATTGLHPCSVKENFEDELNHVKEIYQNQSTLLKDSNIVAVGEIGMDLYWDKTFIEEQKHAFRIQIQWAKEWRLPIIIHTRDSFNEVFEIVDSENDDSLTGVFHCFTGTIEQANHIINYGGFKMGIGGVVTFKNSGLDKVVKEIDSNHIVLETDSPYLAPTPYRGKRNESSYLLNIADKLSDIWEISLEKVADITTKNAKEVFKI